MRNASSFSGRSGKPALNPVSQPFECRLFESTPEAERGVITHEDTPLSDGVLRLNANTFDLPKVELG